MASINTLMSSVYEDTEHLRKISMGAYHLRVTEHNGKELFSLMLELSDGDVINALDPTNRVSGYGSPLPVFATELRAYRNGLDRGRLLGRALVWPYKDENAALKAANAEMKESLRWLIEFCNSDGLEDYPEMRLAIQRSRK